MSAAPQPGVMTMQALGGHQNAHRRERTLARPAVLQRPERAHQPREKSRCCRRGKPRSSPHRQRRCSSASSPWTVAPLPSPLGRAEAAAAHTQASQGDGVSGPAPLDWEQRSAISLAAARGVAAIHLAGPSSCHGNIKSSNVLLTGTHDACVSEHGLTFAMFYYNASGYRAPELPVLTGNWQVSQKADVYSFGILLLELLTRKAPAEDIDDRGAFDLLPWVCSVVREKWTIEVFDVELREQEQKGEEEEHMVQLLQLAINCCSQDADSRPTMSDVVQWIEEIQQSLTPDQEPPTS